MEQRTLVEAFARRVQDQPLRLAIVSEAWRLTYGDLDVWSERIAGAILTRTREVGNRVALLMRHDAPLFVAVLGVVKAGRVVVVLNPGDPAPRLTQVLADAEPSLVIADEAHRHLVDAARQHCPVLSFEEAAGSRTRPVVRPNDLVFLVYTSGSTGRPNAVMLRHRNILDNVRRLTARVDLHPDDRVALFASLSGGQGLATAWCALSSGATLYPYAFAERGLYGLGEWLRRHAVTVQTCTTSLFRQAIDTLDPCERFPSVRLVRLGAESATADDLAALRRHYSAECILLHTYSSCETGNITQAYLPTNSVVPAGRLAVGHPSVGIQVSVVDSEGRELPRGQTGRIVIRGRHLSPGYWRNETLTAERFREHDGVHSYCGGDLGRFLECGQLQLVGRGDGQVKVRGHRVDPGEIEESLLRQPEVRQAAVVVSESNRLVAYVAARPGHDLRPEKLRRRLRELLPEHLVPSLCVVIEQLPLTPQGKVDRERLRSKPATPVVAPSEFATATEARLADVWRRVLNARAIGRNDTFFDLGGDSLQGAAVAALVRTTFGIDLGLAAFVGTATLADLAARIDASERVSPQLPPLICIDRSKPLPLSSTQERFWRFSQTPEASAGYVKARACSLIGPLDVDRLNWCMNYVIGRHEILRTTFHDAESGPVQVIHPPGYSELPILDFSDSPDPEAKAITLLREVAARPFDLGRLPLVRFWLVRLRPQTHWLLRVHHHLISDSWSWVVYFREVACLYEASLAGQPSPLPPLAPVQYGDYAIWQRALLRPQSEAYQATVGWWRRHLVGGSPLELPFRRRVPASAVSPHEGYQWWGLESRISARAERLAREEGATYFAVRLAALVALLAANPRQDDMVLGTYVSDVAAGHARTMFGPFTNLVTLRLRVDPSATFRQWLALVSSEVLATRDRADIPYEVLAEELRRQGTELPEIRMIFQASEQSGGRFGGVELTWVDRQVATMPWGFSLAFEQHQERDRNWAAFDACIYDPEGVRLFLDRYVRLLDAVTERPNLTLTRLWDVA